MTNPKLYDAAHWGIRVLGLNVTYWEANALYWPSSSSCCSSLDWIDTSAHVEKAR